MTFVPPPPETGAVGALRERLHAAGQRRLGRSLALFHVPTGGCNGCELELRLLDDVAYALRALGLRFAPSPLAADVLLATGPLCRSMAGPLARAWEAMSTPKWCVAVGDCAVDGGAFRGSYAVADGVGAAVAVDLVVRGCPPTPEQVLAALVLLLEANAGVQVGQWIPGATGPA